MTQEPGVFSLQRAALCPPDPDKDLRKLPVINSIVSLRSSLDVVLLFASPRVSIARSFQ